MKTIQDIFDQGQEATKRVGELHTIINNEVSNEASLQEMNSTSKTAVFKLIQYVVSAISWLQEQLWLAFKADTQKIIDSAIAGTDRWLANEVRKFQLGDALIFDAETAKYFYNIIDPEKQIIKRVAIVSGGGLTTIKVAKEDEEGSPIPLISAELGSLNSYINKVQWAGSNINIVSFASDKIKLPIAVYYNALTSLGTIQTEVENAINNYLANLPFNGTMYLTKLVDAIQSVEGIIDVDLGAVEARYDAGEFAAVTRLYNPLSGYITIDEGFALSTTINYVAS